MKVVTFLTKVYLVVAFLLIVSNWQNFKTGFNGKPTIAKECITKISN